MSRILVTGADGFIGSHLVERLCFDGHAVRALAQYNSFNSWGWLEDVPCLADLEVITGDVRDPAMCRMLVKDIDVVFHLAALIAIPFSYVAPATYVDTNVNGTLNMCQAALEADVSRIVHVSTSEVYGTALYVPIDESHPIQPQSPYSATKIGADAIAMSFHHAFELPVAIARPFNTYGPRQSARAVIPTIIGQLAAGVTEIELGDVSPTRDFNFVSDTAGGMIAIANCDAAVGGAVNIGSGSDISIAGLFDLIKDVMGLEATYITDDTRVRPAGSEVFRLQADSSRLAELTGFSNEITLRDGLKKTAAWFSDAENLAKYKTNVYNV